MGVVMAGGEASDEGDLFDWASWNCFEPLAVDTETTGLGWKDTTRMVQFGNIEQGFAVDVECSEGRGIVENVLHCHAGLFVFHNSSFDISKLEMIGCDPRALWERAADTFTIAHVLDSSRRNGLDALVKSVLGDEDDAGYKKQFRAYMRKNKVTWATVALDALAEYGTKDAVKTALLYALLWPQLTMTERDIVLREMEVAREMWEVYKRGMRLDIPYAEKLQRQWGIQLAGYRDEFDIQWGITNPNANAQIADALQKQGWEPKVFTEKTNKPKLDKAILTDLAGDYPLVDRLLEYKRIAKWKAAYVDNCLEQVDEGGRVHASYNSLGARTGRMSCSNPPLQQLPKGGGGEVRRLFVASPGHVIASVDYSAIEFRLAGHFSGDARILEVYRAGGDWYQQVADDLGITRPEAKVFVLAITYGARGRRIARALRIRPSRGTRLVSEFWESYPTLAAWVEQVEVLAEQGVTLTSEWGRRLRPHAPYAAANAVIQGTAAEVLKDGLLRLRDAELSQWIVACVHDEVILEVPELMAASIAREVAETLTDNTFDVPLPAEWRVLGKSWGDGYS